MTSSTALALPPPGRAPTPPTRRPRPSAPPRFSCERTIGTEAPLDPLSDRPVAPARHALSFRWLGASVLTAVAGTALLGSAIYVSSDGDFTFAEPAERAPQGTARSGEPGAAARKGDKLVRAETVASAKQTVRQPMTLRSGDREVIKVRTFVRIATNLSLTSGAFAADIPAFNPMRFFADSGPDRIAEAPPETSDAEVSVTKSDLATYPVDTGPALLTDEQVAAQIAEDQRAGTESLRRAGSALPAAAALSRMLGQAHPAVAEAPSLAGPFRSIEVKVVPENVTDFGKTLARGSAFDERVVAIRRGETLEAVLRASGALPDDIRPILAALGGQGRATSSPEGMQLRLLGAPPARPGEARRLVRAILFGERGIEAIAAINDRGSFVSVAPPASQSAAPDKKTNGDEEDDEEEGGGTTLYNSLYETALKQELPRPVIEELVRIFGYDVDFQRRVQAGDSFEIFYAQDDDSAPDRLEILSCTLTLGSDVHRVYRYQGDDGTVDYFDGEGRSLKKFLIRKPVVEARMSSGFGSRFHPILGYAKMHTGVDWAAKVGTPIFAAGNGTIVKAAMDSGYGRRTEIQHTNGYVTAYNHQSAFARGIVPGARVRQGQVIGYVGSSGLSTGAHLHYEVIVNGHFVDPMRIRVPRGRELDGRALADFGRQREQVDQLLAKASPNRFAGRG